MDFYAAMYFSYVHNLHMRSQGCAQVLKSGGYIKVFQISKICDLYFYAQIIPRKFLVDTTYVHMYVLHKAAGN